MAAVIDATLKKFSDIITEVTAAMDQARASEGQTTQYVHNPYKMDINPGTSDGLKLYLKAVKKKEKDEDRIKILQSNSKLVVTCMKDLTETFGWSVITIKIDDTKNSGKTW